MTLLAVLSGLSTTILKGLNATLTLELSGMGVAAGHHGRGLGHARIGLPQPDPVPGRQVVEPNLSGSKVEIPQGRFDKAP